MIISHKHKFIFIKTKKTAGTSIEIALSKFCGPNDIITPITENDEAVRASLGYRGPQNYINNWLKIIEYLPIPVLRNKFKKFYTFYNHMTAHEIKKYIDEALWDSYFKFCFERNPYDKTISKYYWHTNGEINLTEYLKQSYKSLSDWNHYTINNKIAVDFIGKYENLPEDLSYISNILGLDEDIKIPVTKNYTRKDKRHYRNILTDEHKKIIDNIFDKELNYFNYKW